MPAVLSIRPRKLQNLLIPPRCFQRLLRFFQTFLPRAVYQVLFFLAQTFGNAAPEFPRHLLVQADKAAVLIFERQPEWQVFQ